MNKLTRSYNIILQLARVLFLPLRMGFSDAVNLIFARLYVYHFTQKTSTIESVHQYENFGRLDYYAASRFYFLKQDSSGRGITS
jgi:hypothetical protein